MVLKEPQRLLKNHLRTVMFLRVQEAPRLRLLGWRRAAATRQHGRHLESLPGGQKVGPDVDRLIGQLEEAQDAVGG